jgi:alpha-1,6-mannosyltransferase
MSNKIGIYIAAVVMLILTLDIGYFVERQDFTHLITAYSLMFGAYFFILKKQNLLQVCTTYFSLSTFHFSLFTALILRGVLLFSTPNLSEDVYRFIWDGRLIHLGINPFNYKPAHFIENQLFTETLTPQLFQLLNSKNYFTVYPPVCQVVFAAAVWLFPTSIYGSMVVIKGFLFLCEIGTIYLMLKMLKDKRQVLIYALNPLIIIELCGNAHFEAAMIFFFLLAIFILRIVIALGLSEPVLNGFSRLFYAPTDKSVYTGSPKSEATGSDKSEASLRFWKGLGMSASIFALSIASKMLPLMFLPFFLRRLGLKKSFFYFISIGLFLLLLFSLLYNAVFINNIKTSLNLYFEKFEFNASVYYVYSTIEIWRWGFNPILNISKVLMSVVFISIILLAFFEKNFKISNFKFQVSKLENVFAKNVTVIASDSVATEKGDEEDFSETFFERCLFAISIYFLCAAIVHPWYAALPLAISIFTRFRYTMVWTFLLPFTYIHYSYPKPTENFWVIGVEYFVVISFFIFELMKIGPLSIFIKKSLVHDKKGTIQVFARFARKKG